MLQFDVLVSAVRSCGRMPVTGKQQRISRESVDCCENTSRKHLRIQSFANLREEIPCATEQGINSTTTGNLIPANRELIRDNRESAKSMRSPDEALIPTVALVLASAAEAPQRLAADAANPPILQQLCA